jgi:hypothetical protein
MRVETLTLLPEGFIPYQQWPEYNAIASISKFFRLKSVGVRPIGTQLTVWPLCFEEYMGDIEPDLSCWNSSKQALVRIIIWRRVMRKDIPRGWHLFSRKPDRTVGFTQIHPNEAYFIRWSKVARYDRRQWLTRYLNNTYVIENVSLEEFEEAYKKSTLGHLTRHDMSNSLRLKFQKDPTHITLWAARRTSDRKILAGIAIISSPTYHASFYYIGFFRREINKDPVMTGLVDHWFQWAQKKEIMFLHFGSFWQVGDPESWKGFSKFKEKFRPQYIVHPSSLHRFIFKAPFC